MRYLLRCCFEEARDLCAGFLVAGSLLLMFMGALHGCKSDPTAKVESNYLPLVYCYASVQPEPQLPQQSIVVPPIEIITAQYSRPRKTPGCEWLPPLHQGPKNAAIVDKSGESVKQATDKKSLPVQNESQSGGPSKVVHPKRDKPSSPARDAEANAARPIAPTESVPERVIWTTWAKAQAEKKPAVFLLSTSWCVHCPAMLKHFSDRQVIEACQGVNCVHLKGVAFGQMWHVKNYPTLILVDADNMIQHRIEGLIPAEDLAIAIRKFTSDLKETK